MKLLIVDDDGLIRDSLKIMLELVEGWTARTAANGEEAFLLCGQEAPDIILMDIRMPVCDGVEATRKIKEAYPSVKIIMLTTFSEEGYIAAAIHAGAEGYLLKSTPADGIAERIRAVEKGAMVFDKGVPFPGRGVSVSSPASSTPEPSLFETLTERENEVLELVASGLSNGEIAGKLYLSPGTVRNLVSGILEKLELRDRTQLAVFYWKTR